MQQESARMEAATNPIADPEAIRSCWRRSVFRHLPRSHLVACWLALAACVVAPVVARAAGTQHCAPDAEAIASAQMEAALHATVLQATGAPPEVASVDGRDRGFLWRIERDGHVSWLYGTVHVARAAWLLPGPRVLAAFKASDTVALELDMLDADIQRRLAEGMRARPDETLPESLAARLHAQLVAACLPPAVMAQLAPEVQLAALTTLAARADGLDPAFAIDSELAALARMLGKPVVSLETPESQIALLRGDPSTAEERLDQGLAELEQDKVRPMLLHVATIWDEGRADELARYTEWCECTDTEAERAELKRLLDDRNPLLADRIADLHASGHRVFAAVGALHMFGPHGLPQLLAQRGFDVRRVDFAP